MRRFVGTAFLCASVGCGADGAVTASAGGTDDASTDSGNVDDGLDETTTDGPAPPPLDPFAGARLIEMPFPGGNFAFGDYDNDGADDIVTSYQLEFGTTGFDQLVLAMLSFNPETERLDRMLEHEVGFIAPRIFPAHVDGNGQLDALVVSPVGGGTTQIAVVDDDFEIAPSVDIWGEFLGAPIDYDADGRTEYLGRAGTTVAIFSVDLAGGWEQRHVLEVGDCTPFAAHWYGATDTGRLSLLVVGQCDEHTSITTFTQAEDGSMSPRFQGEVPLTPATADLADFDGDGLVDLFISSSHYADGDPPIEATVLAGVSGGSFGEQLAQFYSTAEFGQVSLLALDLNGDGVLQPLMRTYGEVLEGVDDDASIAFVRVGDEIEAVGVPLDISPHHAADLNGDGCAEALQLSSSSLKAMVLPCE